MKARESFLWGCIGGVAPEALRFFKVISTGAPLPSLNWTLYSIVLAVYVVLAGAVTIAFSPDSPWKGIWVGASLPAIFAILTQAAPAMPK